MIVDDLKRVPKKYGTIYADPPWRYSNTSTRSAAERVYDGTMSVDEICALPVPELSASAAHLHLWTTNAFLPHAFKVITSWGFTYKSCFVWAKPQMGIGNYWRVSHEFLLLGIKGDASRFAVHNLKSWASISRSKHSKKPSEVRKMIEMTSPGPDRLEMFAREVSDGWDCWGNELPKATA